MYDFQTIEPKAFTESPFDLIGNEWMLITAEKDGVVNTMTASWGGLGVMWNKNVSYMVIRQSRFTKEFVDAAGRFSLSFLEHKEYAKELTYLGTVSGRDEEKIQKANLNVQYREGVPFIGEASKVLICKKLFCKTMTPDHFLTPELCQTFYEDQDYHDLYISEINEILVKK